MTLAHWLNTEKLTLCECMCKFTAVMLPVAHPHLSLSLGFGCVLLCRDLFCEERGQYFLETPSKVTGK